MSRPSEMRRRFHVTTSVSEGRPLTIRGICLSPRKNGPGVWVDNYPPSCPDSRDKGGANNGSFAMPSEYGPNEMGKCMMSGVIMNPRAGKDIVGSNMLQDNGGFRMAFVAGKGRGGNSGCQVCLGALSPLAGLSEITHREETLRLHSSVFGRSRRLPSSPGLPTRRP